MIDIKKGLSWRWLFLKRYWFLIGAFRNGASLVRNYRKQRPSDRAVCWDGTVIRHPPGKRGLVETLLEVWHEQVYTGPFYTPRPGDLVIDAGSNVGLFSIWLARRQPDCRVIALEPFPENFDLLVENLRSARASRVEPHQAALGGCSGFGRMREGGSRSLDHKLETGGDPGSVRVYSFRELLTLTGGGEVALCKVDIEGSEEDLFRDADPADLRRVRRFAVEYHENIRPGVLTLIRSRLAPDYEMTVRPAEGCGYGMLYATRHVAP